MWGNGQPARDRPRPPGDCRFDSGCRMWTVGRGVCPPKKTSSPSGPVLGKPAVQLTPCLRGDTCHSGVTAGRVPALENLIDGATLSSRARSRAADRTGTEREKQEMASLAGVHRPTIMIAPVAERKMPIPPFAHNGGEPLQRHQNRSRRVEVDVAKLAERGSNG